MSLQTSKNTERSLSSVTDNISGNKTVSNDIADNILELLNKENDKKNSIFVDFPEISMPELRQSKGFIDNFFSACTALTSNFSNIHVTSDQPLKNVMAIDPTLSQSWQGEYQQIALVKYLRSYAASFLGSRSKIVDAKLSLLEKRKIWKTEGAGKALYNRKGKLIKPKAVSISSKKQATSKVMKGKIPLPSKVKVVKPFIKVKKNSYARNRIVLIGNKQLNTPKRLTGKDHPKKSKLGVEPQPLGPVPLPRENLLPDPPQRGITQLAHLQPNNLIGSYQDYYENKFREFFKKLQQTAPVTYAKEINPEIDSFLKNFYELYQELIFISEKKMIYSGDVNQLEYDFLICLKQKNRIYEEVWEKLHNFDYTRFRFKISPCLKRR